MTELRIREIVYDNLTAVQASAITPAEGHFVFVTSTNGTFTKVGFWQYVLGAWQYVPLDSELVHLAGAETITGSKTYSDSLLTFTDPALQVATAGNINFMRLVNGKSKMVLSPMGAFVAEFVMFYGSDVQAFRQIIQQSTSAQVWYGTSVGLAVYNPDNKDVDHVFRGSSDDNLLRVDAGNDNVGVGASSTNPSAKLQVDSTTGGVLIPRLTTPERDAISSPATGLLIFDSTDGEFEFYDGSAWTTIEGSAGAVRHGEAYMSSSAVTTISTVNTPVKVLGTTTAGELSNFTMPSNNRITYTGVETSVFNVDIAVSMSASGNNKLVSLYIAKNGVVLVKSQIQRFIANGTDLGAGNVASLVSLSTNDYVELWIENNTDSANLTVEKMNMSASA